MSYRERYPDTLSLRARLVLITGISGAMGPPLPTGSVAQRYLIKIDGMHAVHAVRALETALGGLPGVRALEVSMGEAAVTHDGRVTPTRIREAIHEAGFAVTSVIEDRRHRLPLLE